MAHLIRDVKFLVEHPNTKNQAYGERLLEHLRKLFRAIHRRDEYKSEETFRQALKNIEVDMSWDATVNPETDEAFNMAERFIQHGESYFRFITTPGIDPRTIWPSKPSGLWRLTGASLKALEEKRAKRGANGFGRPLLPASGKDDRCSTSCVKV